jgi:hypothetical protein
LQGIGTNISCNQGRRAQPGDGLSCLYAYTAGFTSVGVGHRGFTHAIHVNNYEERASSKPGVKGRIQAGCSCANTCFHQEPLVLFIFLIGYSCDLSNYEVMRQYI